MVASRPQLGRMAARPRHSHRIGSLGRLLLDDRWFAPSGRSTEDGHGRDAGLSRPALILATAVLGVAAAWPLLVFGDLGLRDYPNHLARAFILLHPDDRYISMHYRAIWTSIPDLGWDLWAMAIGRLASLGMAAKVFICPTFRLPLVGCL